jgi:hypothetical protein
MEGGREKWRDGGGTNIMYKGTDKRKTYEQDVLYLLLVFGLFVVYCLACLIKCFPLQCSDNNLLYQPQRVRWVLCVLVQETRLSPLPVHSSSLFAFSLTSLD